MQYPIKVIEHYNIIYDFLITYEGPAQVSLTVAIKTYFYSLHNPCLLGLVVASATAEQEVLGSIPGSSKVFLGFSIRNLSVKVTESELVPG